MKSFVIFCCCILFVDAQVRASVLPIMPGEQVRQSSAVFRGTVVEVQSYVSPADQFIYTRTLLRVDETFKGKLPPVVKLVHRGGEVAGRGEVNDLFPQFKAGDERLIFAGRRGDGTLFARRGPAGAVALESDVSGGTTLLTQLRSMTAGATLPGEDLTDQSDIVGGHLPNGATPLTSPSSTATNLFTDSSGIPARFLQPDRGDGIPYYVDADYLPSGITLAQALSAVQSAMAAWTNVTSLRYQFMGIQSFGQAVGNVPISDGRLLIQLHDHYNSITGSGDTLGVGGHGWVVANSPSGWTTGGNVLGNDFHQVTGGTVVIAHTNSFFTGNPVNLAEVLCHEIGHTIGLAHSSQNPNETNQLLAQAIMYYAVHGNGRGATLNAWDINVVRQVHPPTNTPPWCYSRVLDAVTCPGSFTTAGVNAVEIRGYDLHAANLTFVMADQSSMNGTYSAATNGVITYLANGWYTDSGRLDPAGNTYYDMVYARWSDGVNASPYATLRVVSMWSDSYSEGIPDTWRATYFGNANPSVGAKHHATDDCDGDGYSNIAEFRLGSNPTNKNSNLSLLISPTNIQWQAKGYELYELWSSTNMRNWARYGSSIVPTNFSAGTDIFNLTNSTGVVSNFTNGNPQQFFRLVKVP